MTNFLTDPQRSRLRQNGLYNATLRAHGEAEFDFAPVVKLFCPWGGGTWLLSEILPDDHDLAFGLCDLGLGFPELGYVSLSELESLRGPGGLTIERDDSFRPAKRLSTYAEEAHAAQQIVA